VPDEGQLAPVRLVVVARADARRVVGELVLVACDRLAQLVRDCAELRRNSDRRCECANLVAIVPQQQRTRALERLLDGVRAGGRVSVGVTADPAAEAERRRCAGRCFR